MHTTAAAPQQQQQQQQEQLEQTSSSSSMVPPPVTSSSSLSGSVTRSTTRMRILHTFSNLPKLICRTYYEEGKAIMMDQHGGAEDESSISNITSAGSYSYDSIFSCHSYHQSCNLNGSESRSPIGVHPPSCVFKNSLGNDEEEKWNKDDDDEAVVHVVDHAPEYEYPPMFYFDTEWSLIDSPPASHSARSPPRPDGSVGDSFRSSSNATPDLQTPMPPPPFPFSKGTYPYRFIENFENTCKDDEWGQFVDLTCEGATSVGEGTKETSVVVEL